VHEYAVLSPSGAVLSIVMTGNLQHLAARFPEYQVLPVDEVPLRALENYRYWAERP
jgi:hypothetical protein